MRKLTQKRVLAVVLSVLPMVIYYLLLILFILLFVLLFRGKFEKIYDRVFPFLNAGAMTAGAAIVCAILKKRTGKRLKDVLSIKEFDGVLFLLLLIFSWCAVNVADNITAHICSNFIMVKSNSSPVTSLDTTMAVLVTPVLEEIIFRYLGTEFAEQYFPMPFLCMMNAVYFAIMHGYNVQGFINVMVFALCMAYAYLRTRRLAYVVLVHMLHNASCLLDYGDCIFFGSPIYREKNGFVLGSPQWIAVNLTAAIVCAVIYYAVFVRCCHKKIFKKRLK